MKKITSIFVTLIMLINICPCMTAWADAASYNPYEKIQAVSTPALSAHTGQASNGRVQLTQYIAVFKNLDFSDGVQRLTMNVTGSPSVAPKFVLYFFPSGQITDDNGFKSGFDGFNWFLRENGATIAPHYEKDFAAGTYPDEWVTQASVNIDIPDGDKYKGLYDVVIGSSYGDLFSLQFYSMVSEASATAELTDADGSKTSSVSTAATITANAEVSLAACEEKNVRLTIGIYDNDNNLLYKNNVPYLATDMQNLKSGNINLSCRYDNGSAMTDAAYAALFVTVDGRLIKSQYYGTHTPINATSESFDTDISASANEGKITVCGNIGAAEDTVMVYLKNADELLYIQEVAAKNGNYKCEFSPDIPSGTYTAEVIGEKGGRANCDVEFISYKSIIDEINNAADVDAIKQILTDNAALIGIDLSSADTDTDWIYEEIYKKRAELKNISAVNSAFDVLVALADVNNGGADNAVKNKGDVLGIPNSYKALYEADETASQMLIAAVREYISKNGKIADADIFVKIIYDTVVASKTLNAYADNNFVDQPDKVIGRIEAGAVADLDDSSYVRFKNMDFGSTLPKTVAISYGVPASFANGDIYICLDSKENVLLTVKTRGTPDWNVFSTEHYVLPESAARQLMGVHDIYVRFGGKGNFKTLSFTNEYIKADNPQLNGYDAKSDLTENVADIKSATASSTGYMYTGSNNNISLILSAYDENGSVMKIKSNGGTDFDNAEFNKNAEITGLDNPKSVYAVLVNVQNGKITGVLGKSIKGIISNTVPEQPKLVQSSDGKVSVYGKTDNAENAVIFIKKADVAVTDFDNYALVYETAVNADGTFGYAFSMPQDNRFASGTYNVFVIDNKGGTYEDNFTFASVQDIGHAVEIINAAQSVEDFKELLNDPSKNSYGINLAEVLDIDAVKINSCTDPMKIYQMAFECKKTGFTSGGTVTNAVNNAVLAYELNNNLISTSIYERVKNDAGSLGITGEKMYTDYFLKFGTERQNIFDEKLKSLSAQATSVASTVDAVYKAVVLAGFTNELSWGNVDRMFNTFADIFEGAYTGYRNTLNLYNALTDEQKHTICSNYVEKTGLTIDGIARSLKQYYDSLPKNQSGGSTGGSGGNGSKGGGTFNGAVIGSPGNEQAPTTVTVFSDLSNYEWARKAIESLAGIGAVNGRGNGEFDPAAKVTREEFITMLLKAMGETSFSESCSFNDVKSDAWYFKYICTAAEKGIISGYTDGSFGVGKAISREEMCVMVKRASSVYGKYYSENNPTAAFADSGDVAGYAQDAVMSLARAGIVNGMGDHTFAPKANTSRAEAAVIIYRTATL